MDQNSRHDLPLDDAEPDLPDRVHYLLPEGCKDITDVWFQEQEQTSHGREEQRGAAINILNEDVTAYGPASGKASKSVLLPAFMPLRRLAEILGLKMYELIRELIGMKLFFKFDAVLDYETAAHICAELGIVARREEGK